VKTSQAVEDVIASDDVADWLLKVKASWASGFATEVVCFGIVVTEDDVVFEDEGAVRAARIPTVDIESCGRVGNDGVVGEENGAALTKIEWQGIFCAAEVGKVRVVGAGLSWDGFGHAAAVADCNVVGEDCGISLAPHLNEPPPLP